MSGRRKDNDMNIKIKKLHNDTIIPTRGSEQAAGYDLYAYLGGSEECKIEPNKTYKIGTGIAMQIPDGYFGAVFARSGLSTKKGLRPANCVGVIDSDYRGEIGVALHNDSEYTQTILANERIAQIVFLPYIPAEFDEVKELNDTERGEGGFGSTGTTKEQK